MNYMLSLIGAESAVPQWVVDSFPVLRIIFAIAIAILCLALTVIILVQPSASNGNAVTGQSDTYYGKNQSETLEGLFKKLTVILSIVIAVIAVLYVITVLVFPGV